LFKMLSKLPVCHWIPWAFVWKIVIIKSKKHKPINLVIPKNEGTDILRSRLSIFGELNNSLLRRDDKKGNLKVSLNALNRNLDTFIFRDLKSSDLSETYLFILFIFIIAQLPITIPCPNTSILTIILKVKIES
jgi:hypothetical protein